MTGESFGLAPTAAYNEQYGFFPALRQVSRPAPFNCAFMAIDGKSCPSKISPSVRENLYRIYSNGRHFRTLWKFSADGISFAVILIRFSIFS